jgi:hypothetical protein
VACFGVPVESSSRYSVYSLASHFSDRGDDAYGLRDISLSAIRISNGAMDKLDTYSGINDDILPTEEESSLSRVQPIRYLLKE